MPENTVHLKNFYNNIIKTSPLYYGHQFVVTFYGDMPDAMKKDSNDLNSITYYVKSAKVPGTDIKENKVSFLSQQFVVPGGITYGETWDVEFIMTTDMIQYDAIYEWQNWFADLSMDGGATAGYKKIIPETEARVSLLDATLQTEIRKFILKGIYPTKIGDLKMKYENNSNGVPFSCTFTYQYCYEDIDGDPLKA